MDFTETTITKVREMTKKRLNFSCVFQDGCDGVVDGRLRRWRRLWPLRRSTPDDHGIDWTDPCF
jgi:hypothetical protein